MNVEMPDGLAGGDANVEADVVAVRSVVLLDDLLGQLDCEREGGPFVRSGGEPIGGMPTGNEEGVARRDREGVPEADRRYGRYKKSGSKPAPRWRGAYVRLHLWFISREPKGPGSTKRST